MDSERTESLDRVYDLIRQCGRDSLHYLSLNMENSFFFGEKAKDVIAYTLIGKRTMSMGDPVCEPADMEAFVSEYLEFCGKMGRKPIFSSVSERMAEILKKYDYIVLKYGEEAVLRLDAYTMPKSSTALRRNYNKVAKTGALLKEYSPGIQRDYGLEEEIKRLAKQYYVSKGYKMGYSVGGLDFDCPYDRRFFITADEAGELLTFLSFLPYDGRKKYCVDIMYRKIDSITGVMEHAILSAVMRMKEEGVEEVSLGVAPLAGIDVENPDISRTEKLFHSLFDNMEYGYNFKNLYRFKKKFAPTLWEPRYLVYHPGISLKKLALAIARTRQETVNPAYCVKYVFFAIADFCGLHRAERKNA